MSHTHPAVEGVTETSATLDRTLSRNSVFRYLLEALLEYRRRQAARTIHHHRHLLEKYRTDTTSG